MPFNGDISSIVTPVIVDRLRNLLIQSNYNHTKTQYLIRGFSEGFDICYQGPWDRKDEAKNIPLRPDIGDAKDLWEKMVKEVKLKRFAGLFETMPWKHYVQSPIGLVPKSNGQTRLIFHLSFDFTKSGGNKSINHFIPEELCTVKYRDLNYVITRCLEILERCPGAQLWFGVSDLKSAFRVIPLSPKCFPLLAMKAQHPVNKKWYYFVDKCLPFGASISCAIFQSFSNALVHIAAF